MLGQFHIFEELKPPFGEKITTSSLYLTASVLIAQKAAVR